jgi:microcystin-dependent protein
MADIIETSIFEPVRLIESDDYVTGGVGGTANIAPTQLANRTKFLYDWLSQFTGMIIPFPKSTPPEGWVELNGALLSRTAYSALWAFVQVSGNLVSESAWQSQNRTGQFSTGDGSTNFRLMDLRAEFIRAWDHGAGIDTGRTLGSWQADEFKSHTHRWRAASPASTVVGGFPQVANSYVDDTSYLTTATGGVETRPRNVAFMYCIKY